MFQQAWSILFNKTFFYLFIFFNQIKQADICSIFCIRWGSDIIPIMQFWAGIPRTLNHIMLSYYALSILCSHWLNMPGNSRIMHCWIHALLAVYSPMAEHESISTRRSANTSQHSECCSLTRSVDTQQTETLTRRNTKVQSIHCSILLEYFDQVFSGQNIIRCGSWRKIINFWLCSVIAN